MSILKFTNCKNKLKVNLKREVVVLYIYAYFYLVWDNK